QGEAVGGGDEVRRAVGAAATLVEQVARGGEAAGQFRQHAVVAPPEGPHAVAELVVPFAPAGRETAHLVAARAAVPGLGDQLDLAEDRVLAAGHQETVADRKSTR